MWVTVADNFYTRAQFVTLGGFTGKGIIPGRIYQVEEVVGCTVKLIEGRGHWGLKWFEKYSIRG